MRQGIESAFHPLEVLPSSAMMNMCGGHYATAEIVAESLMRAPDDFRLVRGHYHLSMRSLVKRPLSIVVLRDPVSRVVSNLKHNVQHNGMTAADVIVALEKGETLEVPLNQMTRYLGGRVSGATPHEIGSRHDDLLYGPIRNEKERLRSAVGALETIDLLGITEDMKPLSSALAKLGIRIPEERSNVSDVELDLSEAHLQTIRELNKLDVELYESAKKLLARRACV